MLEVYQLVAGQTQLILNEKEEEVILNELIELTDDQKKKLKGNGKRGFTDKPYEGEYCEAIVVLYDNSASMTS